MEELRKFREVNHLTQDMLGSYLGIKKSFISRVENGQVALPLDKFNKLLNNDMGWDTRPLLNGEKIEAPFLGINSDSDMNLLEKRRPMINFIDKPIRNSAASNKKWEEKRIEMLEQRIKELEQQNAEYWELIKKLTDR